MQLNVKRLRNFRIKGLIIFQTIIFCSSLIVSKTTKELVLRWKDDGAPIDISDEVKMPQFEIFKIVDTRCQETMHIGNFESYI